MLINVEKGEQKMKTKHKIFSALESGSMWISNKIERKIKKKQSQNDADVFANLEKLHKLKEQGVINESDYEELKLKLKERI